MSKLITDVVPSSLIAKSYSYSYSFAIITHHTQGIQEDSESGHCIVTRQNPEIDTPLLEKDTILSLNGIQLNEVEGGVDAWVKIFGSLSEMPREVVVR